MKSSNLTFRGYLAGITPVLSVRSFFIYLFFCVCVCVVSSARGPCNLLLIFWHHQLAPSVGNSLATCKPYYRFLDKELHSTHSLNGNHQQHLGRRAATHCFGEAIPNPYSSSGTSHQTKLGLRRTATAEEHRDGHPRGRPRGTSVERRDREGLEGNNTPSRPER